MKPTYSRISYPIKIDPKALEKAREEAIYRHRERLHERGTMADDMTDDEVWKSMLDEFAPRLQRVVIEGLLRQAEERTGVLRLDGAGEGEP